MSAPKIRNAILNRDLYEKARASYKEIIDKIAESDSRDDREEMKAIRFAYYLTQLKSIHDRWPNFFYDLSLFFDRKEVKPMSLNCLRCGMNILIHVRGREYFCDVCEKRVIISTDNYGLGGGLVMEEIEDTVIFR